MENETTQASALKNPMFLVILTIGFLNYNSSTMLNITLPKFANELGASAQAIGLLAGVFAMCALLMRPFSGQIVDNENKIVMLRLCLLTILISVFGLTLSDNYWLLVLFRGMNGLAWGVGSTLTMTIATNCFSVKNMASGIGIYGLAQTLARTLAPMFALPFAAKFGYNNLYYINVALIAFCLVMTLFLSIDYIPPQKKHYSLSLKKMIYFPSLLPATVTFCNSVTKSSINAFLVIFAGTMDIINIGLFFTIQAVIVTVLRPVVSKLADKLGTLKVLIPCEIFIVLSMIIISQARSMPWFILAAVIQGLALAGEQPILMAECVKRADPEKRGSASNTNYIGVDVGMFLGSNLAGLLVTYFGYNRMFLLMAIPVVFCSAFFVYLYKPPVAREEKPVPTEA